jgi:CO/xanthine dehydrogenase Mo-binding subunit
MLMGVGFALWEEVVVGEKGAYLNPSFMDYHVPTPVETVDARVVFADSYEPRGPFGAKSIGELPHNPVASAIANAVSRALGSRVRALPVKPEYVLKHIKKNS